jgi:tetratricopeptide (TPR) repeat protein
MLDQWMTQAGLTRTSVHKKLRNEFFRSRTVPPQSTFYAQLQGKNLKPDTVRAVHEVCLGKIDHDLLGIAFGLLRKAEADPTPLTSETEKIIADLSRRIAEKNEEIISVQNRQIEALAEAGRLREALTRSDALLADSQQLVTGLLWATSELQRELTQSKKDRIHLQVRPGPDAAALDEAQAKIKELEQAKAQLAAQLAQAERDRDAALALHEKALRELEDAGVGQAPPNQDVDRAFEELWTSDPLGQEEGRTDVHTVIARSRSILTNLSEQREALRRTLGVFSTENRDGPGVAEKARHAEAELYARALSSGSVNDLAAWITTLRGGGGTEGAINARLAAFARRGAGEIGGFSRFFQLVEALNRRNPSASEMLLAAAGAHREIGELRPYLRQHADSPIGECFLRGMALQRPPQDLAHALRFLRKGSMSIQEDRALAERVVRILAEFGSDERVHQVLPHLIRTDASTIRQFRQHRRAAGTSSPRGSQPIMSPAGESDSPRPTPRIITGTVVTQKNEPSEGLTPQ